jgi:hypothetical protein
VIRGPRRITTNRVAASNEIVRTVGEDGLVLVEGAIHASVTSRGSVVPLVRRGTQVVGSRDDELSTCNVQRRHDGKETREGSHLRVRE